jgi:hypothetical protein
MAARLNNRHQDLVREKIKVGNIIDRLEKHVAGEIELTAAQVTSAKILLDKSISNAPTIVGGDPENPLQIAWPLPKSPLDQ